MSNSPYAGITALIVDDHDPMRQALKKILTRLGFGEVLVAFDGVDAIEAFENHHIEFIVCDLYMRKVDGFQVIRTVRNRDFGHDAPILVVTGEASKDDIVKAVDLGAQDYLVKPFQAEVVEERIKSMMQSYLEPSDLVRKLHKAEGLFQERRLSEAAAMFQEAVSLDPSSQRARHQLAVAVAYEGDIQRAKTLLNENIKLSKSYYKNYATLADIAFKEKDFSSTIHNLKQELDLNPKQPARQVRLAKLLLQSQDVLGSIKHYREALKEDSKYKKALYGAGHAYARKGDIEKAIYYFKRLRRHAPNETRALEAIVKVSFEAKDPRKAEIVLMNEKGDYPERLDTYVCLAKFYKATDNTEKALEALKQLLVRNPQDPGGLRMKAKLEQSSKDYKAAVETWKALTKVEASKDAFLNLAKCQLEIGQVQPSLKALHRVLVIDPKSADAFFYLGEVYRRTKQYSKGWHLYTVAIKFGVDPQRCKKLRASCAASIAKRRGSGAGAA